MAGNSISYSQRIQRVTDYLAEHLDQALDLETLARVAYLSPYHFHRVYRGLLGETINETVRRLRLHRAALDLLDRELSIERTARRAGYASQAAFTRAFRAEYGEPPARYRGTRRETQPAGERDSALYRVEIVELPRLRVATIEHRGDYRLTSKAFERLMTIAATTGLLASETRTIGIYHDDPEFVPQRSCGPRMYQRPGRLAARRRLRESHIEGGRYARIVHQGAYSELGSAYDWLYQTWLPASAEEPRDLPCLEEYLNNPRQVSVKELETAVLMPLA
jgi:AraC family transcriptional regulator